MGWAGIYLLFHWTFSTVKKKKMASLMTAPTQTFSAETIAAQVRKAVHECEVIDGTINN
jgi:hypothetical protein